ncbi:MAG: hypothetical protein JSS09_04875 [Verrucomicrobia bacterium]|nr:hypothetical protein [Verrucomicrobiota bacterium]
MNSITPSKPDSLESDYVIISDKATPEEKILPPQKSVALTIAEQVLPRVTEGAAIALAATGAISLPVAATLIAAAKTTECALTIFPPKKEEYK